MGCSFKNSPQFRRDLISRIIFLGYVKTHLIHFSTETTPKGKEKINSNRKQGKFHYHLMKGTISTEREVENGSSCLFSNCNNVSQLTKQEEKDNLMLLRKIKCSIP